VHRYALALASSFGASIEFLTFAAPPKYPSVGILPKYPSVGILPTKCPSVGILPLVNFAHATSGFRQ
jgi:hypothetical protein